MTNRIRDASKKLEVGRPKTEDRTRHGPSSRGDPDIRGKPGSCLHMKSRVLAAKKTDDEVGVFIPNRDCFANTLEAKSQWNSVKTSVTSVVKKEINHGEPQRIHSDLSGKKRFKILILDSNK